MANATNTKKSEPVVEDVPEEVTVPAALEAHDVEISDEELLADLPKLVEPTRLRIRQRNELLELVMRAEEFSKDSSLDDTASKIAILNMMAGIDEWAESIAFDKEAYALWAEAQGHASFLALMNRYSVALGK